MGLRGPKSIFKNREDINFSLVIAVDGNHLEKLRLVWPNWCQRRPILMKVPLVVIFDKDSINPIDLAAIVKDHPKTTYVSWPPAGVSYDRLVEGRFGDPQRYKMLAGFVHATSSVETEYWLKLDLDVVSDYADQNWIDPRWFVQDPAIIASPWGYTKPPDQMFKLDQWVFQNRHQLVELNNFPPLNLHPEKGSSALSHSRIISWCGFFRTEFTKMCSEAAEKTCGKGLMPVPSQDGFHWYMAQRLRRPIVRERFKRNGWYHCNGIESIKDALNKVNSR